MGIEEIREKLTNFSTQENIQRHCLIMSKRQNWAMYILLLKLPHYAL